MFKQSANNYIYPKYTLEKPTPTNLYLPLEIDTEFTHPSYDLNNPHTNICTNLTVQCRSITKETGVIYSHPDNPTPRHRIFKYGFVGIDYLEDYNHKVELIRLRNRENKLDAPWIQFDIYSYFAVAELARMFRGVFLTDILTLANRGDSEGIEQGRRLRTYTKVGNKLFNWVELPWQLTLDGNIYKVRIAIYDTCAVHGNANYASFCSSAGLELKHKDNFSTSEKAFMDKMYNERPEDFDNYALGDLYNYDALSGNAQNFYKIYESLGLTKYFTPPKLTTGATISRLFEAVIKNIFGSDADDRSVINAFCKYSSADWLKRKTTTTACLNAKVDGGRCRNNRPIDTTINGVICDIDINGCYGEGLRVQTYPLGIPLVIDYPIKSKNNKYQTLREFLKSYGKELVPGLWQCRVSLKDGYQLRYKQDYLASWFPPNDLSKMPTDSDFCDTDQWWEIDNIGEIKILHNEINHAVVTHEFIQWLDNVATSRQRKELLDNLIVETAIFYPKCERVDSVQELIESHESHTGQNTTDIKAKTKRSKKIAIEMECHAWYGINLGELIVDKLQLERNKYPKKTTFNDLYKLCINTLYGDMVSPFFTVGNVVVGNNITARARALAWCMEKGFNGWQSITDGCAFDINRVLYPRDTRKISGEMTVNLFAEYTRNHVFKPLGHESNLCVTDNSDEYILNVVDGKPALNSLSSQDSFKLVNKLAMKHLQNIFPNLDILHQETYTVNGDKRIGQFEFESKGLYDNGTFHGSANYSLTFNNVTNFSMRSYSKRGVKIVTLEEKLNVSSDDIKPSEYFLLSLKNPKCIVRGRVYIKERILKVGDYRRNYKTWQDTNVYPGCTIETVGLLHEFSLSQFTFNTYAQLNSWRKEYERLIRGYGQSYEMFFLNSDGTLRYQEMIETVEYAIRSDKKNFFDGLDRRQSHLYRSYLKHQELDCLELAKSQLSMRYHGDVLSVEDISHDTPDSTDNA